jgi:hypothetical protein
MPIVRIFQQGMCRTDYLLLNPGGVSQASAAMHALGSCVRFDQMRDTGEGVGRMTNDEFDGSIRALGLVRRTTCERRRPAAA